MWWIMALRLQMKWKLSSLITVKKNSALTEVLLVLQWEKSVIGISDTWLLKEKLSSLNGILMQVTQYCVFM